MSSAGEVPIQRLIDDVVGGVPGVVGAVLASADGFVIAARVPVGAGYDGAAIAAMSASALGLSNRLVQLGGPGPAEVSVHRAAQSAVFVFAVGTAAVLTLIADASADAPRIERIGGEICSGLTPAFQPSTSE